MTAPGVNVTDPTALRSSGLLSAVMLKALDFSGCECCIYYASSSACGCFLSKVGSCFTSAILISFASVWRAVNGDTTATVSNGQLWGLVIYNNLTSIETNPEVEAGQLCKRISSTPLVGTVAVPVRAMEILNS